MTSEIMPSRVGVGQDQVSLMENRAYTTYMAYSTPMVMYTHLLAELNSARWRKVEWGFWFYLMMMFGMRMSDQSTPKIKSFRECLVRLLEHKSANWSGAEQLRKIRVRTSYDDLPRLDEFCGVSLKGRNIYKHCEEILKAKGERIGMPFTDEIAYYDSEDVLYTANGFAGMNILASIVCSMCYQKFDDPRIDDLNIEYAKAVIAAGAWPGVAKMRKVAYRIGLALLGQVHPNVPFATYVSSLSGHDQLEAQIGEAKKADVGMKRKGKYKFCLDELYTFVHELAAERNLFIGKVKIWKYFQWAERMVVSGYPNWPLESSLGVQTTRNETELFEDVFVSDVMSARLERYFCDALKDEYLIGANYDQMLTLGKQTGSGGFSVLTSAEMKIYDNGEITESNERVRLKKKTSVIPVLSTLTIDQSSKLVSNIMRPNSAVKIGERNEPSKVAPPRNVYPPPPNFLELETWINNVLKLLMLTDKERYDVVSNWTFLEKFSQITSLTGTLVCTDYEKWDMHTSYMLRSFYSALLSKLSEPSNVDARVMAERDNFGAIKALSKQVLEGLYFALQRGSATPILIGPLCCVVSGQAPTSKYNSILHVGLIAMGYEVFGLTKEGRAYAETYGKPVLIKDRVTGDDGVESMDHDFKTANQVVEYVKLMTWVNNSMGFKMSPEDFIMSTAPSSEGVCTYLNVWYFGLKDDEKVRLFTSRRVRCPWQNEKTKLDPSVLSNAFNTAFTGYDLRGYGDIYLRTEACRSLQAVRGKMDNLRGYESLIPMPGSTGSYAYPSLFNYTILAVLEGWSESNIWGRLKKREDRLVSKNITSLELTLKTYNFSTGVSAQELLGEQGFVKDRFEAMRNVLASMKGKISEDEVYGRLLTHESVLYMSRASAFVHGMQDELELDSLKKLESYELTQLYDFSTHYENGTFQVSEGLIADTGKRLRGIEKGEGSETYLSLEVDEQVVGMLPKVHVSFICQAGLYTLLQYFGIGEQLKTEKPFMPKQVRYDNPTPMMIKRWLRELGDLGVTGLDCYTLMGYTASEASEISKMIGQKEIDFPSVTAFTTPSSPELMPDFSKLKGITSNDVASHVLIGMIFSDFCLRLSQDLLVGSNRILFNVPLILFSARKSK